MEISEKNQQIIKSFLSEWWADLSWKASQTVIGAELPIRSADELYNSPFGQDLQEMASYAEGQHEREDWRVMEALDIVQKLCEWMFARPAMPSNYHIPPEFWSTPLGDLALRAHLWARKEQLLSMSEAAELSGRSLSDLSNMIARGRLTAYPDPDEPNPRRRNRVMRSEIEALPPVGE